jgi:hypothetical protein
VVRILSALKSTISKRRGSIFFRRGFCVMSDFSQKPSVTLSFGPSGYGKTTFCLKYLVNALHAQPFNPSPAACIFIFDWKQDEISRRLGVGSVTTEDGCEKSLAQKIVVFNPHVMFPGDKRVRNPEGEKVLNDDRMGLRWFCKWAYEVSARGPGRKIIYLDDLANFGCKYAVPPELSRIIRTGRFVGLELLTSTQYPRDYHADIRGGVTEWVCFKCTEENDLAAVRPYFSAVDKVKDLQRGQFISYSRDFETELAGKMF